MARICMVVLMGLCTLVAGGVLRAADGEQLFVHCSVRDVEGGKVFQAPIFEVEAARYDADRLAWRRSVYSRAFLASLRGRGLARQTAIDGCFADVRRTGIDLKELSEPFRAGDDRGYENVSVFAEEGELGEFVDAIGKQPIQEGVAWAPDAAIGIEAALMRQQKDLDAASLENRLSGYIFCRYDAVRGEETRNFFSGVMPKPIRLKHPESFLSRENDIAYPPYGAVYNFFEAYLQSEEMVTDDWTVTREQWGSNNNARPALRYCRSASNRTEAQALLEDMRLLQQRKGAEVIMTQWTWQRQDAESILEGVAEGQAQ